MIEYQLRGEGMWRVDKHPRA